MRVLIISPALGDTLGGGERYAYALLQKLEQYACQFTVVTSLAQREADFWEGTARRLPQTFDLNAPVTQLPILPFPGGRTALLQKRRLLAMSDLLPQAFNPMLPEKANLFPQMANLAEHLATLQPNFDVVHAFNLSWEGPMVAAGQYAKNHDLPLVITPFAHVGNRSGRWNQQMRHQRQLLENAVRLQTLSSVETDGLVNWGYSREKIDLVGVGFAGNPASLAPHSFTDLPPVYALFVGRASRDKGIDEAIKAITTLPDEIVCHLVLAGQLAPEIKAQIEALPSERQALVHFYGRVSEAQKRQLLAQATLFLLPSRSDSFGIVILEAWQHQLPVIAANEGGIPGVIDDGQNGILVPYGKTAPLRDAIRSLLLNPLRRSQLGAAGLQKLGREHSWNIVCERAFSSYKRATF